MAEIYTDLKACHLGQITLNLETFKQKYINSIDSQS